MPSPQSPIEVPPEIDLLSASEIAKRVTAAGSTLNSTAKEWMHVAGLPAVVQHYQQQVEQCDGSCFALVLDNGYCDGCGKPRRQPVGDEESGPVSSELGALAAAADEVEALEDAKLADLASLLFALKGDGWELARKATADPAPDLKGGLSWDDWSRVDDALAFAEEYGSDERFPDGECERLRPLLRKALGHDAEADPHPSGLEVSEEEWPEVTIMREKGLPHPPRPSHFWVWWGIGDYDADRYEIRRYIPAPQQPTYTLEEIREQMLDPETRVRLATKLNAESWLAVSQETVASMATFVFEAAFQFTHKGADDA